MVMHLTKLVVFGAAAVLTLGSGLIAVTVSVVRPIGGRARRDVSVPLTER